MIKVGQQKKAKYRGKFTVNKVAQLGEPVECYSKEIGTALFKPTLVKIDWENPPSEDRHELWFPYWMTIGGREKHGQFAPMIGKETIAYNDKSKAVDDFLEKLLSFTFQVKRRAKA